VGLLDMEINQLTKVWRCTYINMYKWYANLLVLFMLD
jgi:hypothetical protein